MAKRAERHQPLFQQYIDQLAAESVEEVVELAHQPIPDYQTHVSPKTGVIHAPQAQLNLLLDRLDPR